MTKRIIWLANYQIRPKFRLEHDQTRLYDLINIYDQYITFVYNFSQTITAIYDKASSNTHLLTTGANVFRRVFVQKDDILNILGLIQMFVYVIAIRKKSSGLF